MNRTNHSEPMGWLLILICAICLFPVFPSAADAAGVPGAPRAVSAKRGNEQATVSFTPPVSNGGSPITDYTVTSYLGKITATGSESPIAVAGLTNGTVYVFTVTATNAIGTGPASNPSNIVKPGTVPDAPTNVTAIGGNAKATVSFLHPASNGGRAITAYTVTSDTGGITAKGAATPVLVTGLTNGTAYSFTVTATSVLGTGPPSSLSNRVRPATVPGAPTHVTATRGNASATISFSAPTSDGGSAITSYTVTSSPGGNKASGTVTLMTVKGLTNGTAYTFTVTATNAVGTGRASKPSNSVTPTGTSPAVPGAPTNVTAAAGNASATVSFSAPTSDGGSAITSYTVTSSPGGNTASGTGTFITVKGLTNGTTYTFTVRASNAIGTGPPSSPSNSVTPANVPGAPTNVSAKAGNGQATVSFTAPASNGGSPITSYTVTSSLGDAASGISSPITVTGLINGTTYTFTVAATNKVGTGQASSPSNAIKPAPVPGVPAFPLKVSPGNKYLVDQNGVPFQIVGAASWTIGTHISQADVQTYLDDRLAKGFNAIEMMAMVTSDYGGPAPNNYYGQAPFTNGVNDWSVRNENYWTQIDYVVQQAKNRGMVVEIFPAYMGSYCGTEGWCSNMMAQGTSAMTSYGTFFGNRYKAFGNVIYMTGGDVDCSGISNACAPNDAIVAAIRAADSNALFSVEPGLEQVGGIDSYTTDVDINAVYTYGSPDSFSQTANGGSRPFIFVEGWYENEHGSTLSDWLTQAMCAYLGGGSAGQNFGSCPLWNFGGSPGWCNSSSSPFDTWQHNLASPGSVAIGNVGKLMRSRSWWLMVPDYSNAVVTSSKGSGFSYHATARTTAGETVMVWCPDTSQVTVAMTQIGGTQANAWWYTPSTGSSSLIGTYSTTGTLNFTPPSANVVLVLDNAASNLAAPGTTTFVPSKTQ